VLCRDLGHLDEWGVAEGRNENSGRIIHAFSQVLISAAGDWNEASTRLITMSRRNVIYGAHFVPPNSTQ
jgi:hypothetical protein